MPLSLRSRDNTLIYFTTTSREGAFIFPPVPPARYVLYLGPPTATAFPLYELAPPLQGRVEVLIGRQLATRVHVPYIQWGP